MKITKDELNKLFKERGLKFRNYYKYSFYFESYYPDVGITVIAEVGGNSDDIYRLDIEPIMKRYDYDDWDNIEVKDDKDNVVEVVGNIYENKELMKE